MTEGELSRNGPEIAPKSHHSLRLGEFRFDPTHSALTEASGLPVDLRSQSLEVLRLLAEQAGKVVTKVNLIDTVWGVLSSPTIVWFNVSLTSAAPLMIGITKWFRLCRAAATG